MQMCLQLMLVSQQLGLGPGEGYLSWMRSFEKAMAFC